MNIKEIGRAMKLIRQSKEWSLDYESQSLEIHRNTLSKYEDNPEDMTIGLLDKFLKLHNITREKFFNLVYDNSLIKCNDSSQET